MMTLDILICSIDKGIVRVQDVLLEPREGVRYVVSYQYTDARYLDLIPASVKGREDVSLFLYKARGLSANRNMALDKATADLVMYADDDARLLDDTPDRAIAPFVADEELDVAFFQASTYTGRPLKSYPEKSFRISRREQDYGISALEMVCRRRRVQGKVRFDERFGLGTRFLTCGEEEVWLDDALRAGLRMAYIPQKLVETSTMLKSAELYSSAGVMRSRGAIMYYRYGSAAFFSCFRLALSSWREGRCGFWMMFTHLIEGIRYVKQTPRQGV